MWTWSTCKSQHQAGVSGLCPPRVIGDQLMQVRRALLQELPRMRGITSGNGSWAGFWAALLNRKITQNMSDFTGLFF